MAYTTIDKPSDYFNTITYTGDDVDGRTITGVGFQSDWTWVKARSSAFSHYIIDAIRYDSGASKYLKLDSSSSAADETPSAAGWISALNSDGYVCKNGTSNTNNCNENGVTYVAWNWLGANGTASNTDGSITSTVSANTTAGFSIVSYTGTGSTATIGHGLSSTPQVVLIKCRSDATNWHMYHSSVTTADNQVMYLDLNYALSTLTTSSFDVSEFSSSVFGLNTNDAVNGSGRTYIAYCFAEKKGYSKFGSFTGNGSSDGSYIHLGFKPAWVLIKRSSGVESWYLFDNKRNTFNMVDKGLVPNQSIAEFSGYDAIDFTSQGFKIRSSAVNYNTSGDTYIFMAFAESPFVNSNGVPNNAR